MNLSFDQQAAYDKIGDWLKRRTKPVFNLQGYAGTGKSTIAKHLASQANGETIFCAPTGKAAHVLRSQGVSAMTIHKLLYSPNGENPEIENLRQNISDLKQLNPVPEDKLTKARDQLHDLMKRSNLSFSYNPLKLDNVGLIVIDESSMVNDNVAEDVLRLNKPILALGDPAQLPPVAGSGFFSRGEPDWLLTEIHRQASGSPVIRLATTVRQNRPLELGSYGDSRVIRRADIDESWADPASGQILVGKNKTRLMWNKAVRRKRSFEGDIVQNEKLICLKNNYDYFVWNGCIYSVTDISPGTRPNRIFVDVLDDEKQFYSFEILEEDLRGQGAEVTGWERDGCVEVTYGYAITVHKSQGSQWPVVQIVDESSSFGLHSRNHLYTAITRAQEKVTVAI